MYEQVLRKMRELIRARQYVMTLHADEEMGDDALTIFDVEHTIVSGTIVERQTDRQSNEWKYLITGESLHGDEMTVVAKIAVTGKLIIITVYREKP